MVADTAGQVSVTTMAGAVVTVQVAETVSVAMLPVQMSLPLAETVVVRVQELTGTVKEAV